jgi:hypothetical protein
MDFKIKERSLLAGFAVRILKGDRVALTIGETIYLSGVDKATFVKDKKWVLHEMAHIKQFKKYGFFKFIGLYLLESMRKGYYNNRYEKEARKEAGEEE